MPSSATPSDSEVNWSPPTGSGTPQSGDHATALDGFQRPRPITRPLRRLEVAVVAAALAAWQAHIARGARDATAEQVRVAREALDLQRSDRDRRDATQFTLQIEPATTDYSAHVEVQMISGPPRVSVSITFVNGWARRIGPDKIERSETQGGTVQPRQMVKGAASSYGHNAPQDASAIWTTAIIRSKDIDSDRIWEWVERKD
jgi:hypothetical protein